MKPIEIRRRSMAGLYVHLGGHEHSASPSDWLTLGASRIGPIAYALLRAEATTIRDRRFRREKATADEFRDVKHRAEQVSRIDPDRGLGHFRQYGRLCVWDQIQHVHEVCDRLACVFESVWVWKKGETNELGRELLFHEKAADRVIGSLPFADLAWWRGAFMTEPDPERYELLSNKQKALLDRLRRAVDDHIPVAIETVRTVYTKDLHRMAARQRHGSTLLDPELGFAWIGTSQQEQEADAVALKFGALAVADTQGHDPVEYLMPMTDENLLALQRCLEEAEWLLWELCNSVVEQAGAPAGVSVPIDPISLLSAPKALADELTDLVIAYTGYDRALAKRERRRVTRTVGVYAAADRPRVWNAIHRALSRITSGKQED